MKKTLFSIIATAVVIVFGVTSLAAAYGTAADEYTYTPGNSGVPGGFLGLRPPLGLTSVQLCAQLRAKSQQRMAEIQAKGLSLQLSKDEVSRMMSNFRRHVEKACAGVWLLNENR